MGPCKLLVGTERTKRKEGRREELTATALQAAHLSPMEEAETDNAAARKAATRSRTAPDLRRHAPLGSISLTPATISISSLRFPLRGVSLVFFCRYNLQVPRQI
jgi:hypothetical protein